MTKIYHKVFAVSELDRERDESLTMRMSALNFIEPKHLDIPELYHDEKAWLLARKELHKINNYKVCSLNQAVQAAQGRRRIRAGFHGVWLVWFVILSCGLSSHPGYACQALQLKESGRMTSS